MGTEFKNGNGLILKLDVISSRSRRVKGSSESLEILHRSGKIQAQHTDQLILHNLIVRKFLQALLASQKCHNSNLDITARSMAFNEAWVLRVLLSLHFSNMEAQVRLFSIVISQFPVEREQSEKQIGSMTLLATLIGFSVLPGFRDQSINSPMTTVERIPISIIGPESLPTGRTLSDFAMNAQVYWSSQHYLVTVSVGKSGYYLSDLSSRDFKIKIVTDSTAFWIPESIYHRNSNRRKWWKPRVSIPGENSTTIDGFYAKDDLQLGKMQARKEKIVIATTGAPLYSMKRDQYQGVLGSGYKTTTNLNRYSTPFYHFLESRQYTLNVFSFSIFNQSYGELVIGEVDLIHGALSYVAVCDTDEPWTIEFNQVKLDEEAILDNYLMIAQFNPAKPGILVPSMELNTIILALDRKGFSFSVLNGNYVGVCGDRKLPTLRFQFGEAVVNLTNDDYVLRSGNYCVLALSAQTERKTWVFGQVFFRIMYTVFDWGTGKQVPRMAFAKYR